MKSYDLVIIGSGPGGYVAAFYASRHKLNVCVIEKDLIGGTCLNRGCIPTKALLHSASILSKIKESKEYGIEVSGFKVDFSAIAARKDTVVTRLRKGIETLFRANKIDLEIFKVADAAVDELGGFAGSAAREIPFFQERNLHFMLGRKVRDRGAVDPATHDEKIVRSLTQMPNVPFHGYSLR